MSAHLAARCSAMALVDAAKSGTGPGRVRVASVSLG